MEVTVYEKIMFIFCFLFAIATNISTAATSCIIALSILTIIIQYIKTKKLPRYDKPIARVCLVYVVLQCIIAAMSLAPKECFGEVWAATYRFFPLFMVMGYVRNENQVKFILCGFLFSVLINDAFGAYQYFIMNNTRPAGFNNTPTFFASHLLMAIPILYFVLRQSQRGDRIHFFSIGILAISIFMLVASGTRGGWVAFIFVLLASLLLDKNNRKKICGACIVLGILFGLFAYNTQFIQQRVESISDIQYSTNKERLLMWQSAIAIFEDYPVFGVGQDQFGGVYNTKYISPLAKERPETGSHHGHPHNNFFKFLAEGGIVGITAFLLLHGYFLYRMIMLYRKEKDLVHCSCGMIGGLVIIGLHIEGLTDTNANQVPIMREFWFLMGLLLATGKMQLQHKDII